jgi:hypothetical protein
MIFASYRLPIITDYCADPAPFVVFQDALIHFDPRKSSVMNKELVEAAVGDNYRMITETHNFKAEVDRLITLFNHKLILNDHGNGVCEIIAGVPVWLQ